MADGIYTALTGAIAQQQALDVTANNVANATTTGFRADRAVFGEFLAGAQRNQPQDPTLPRPPRPDVFVRMDETTLDTTGGGLRLTGNPLDLALQGDGFFVVKTQAGDRLTRAGNFVQRANGVISTVDGHTVMGATGKPLIVPPQTRELTISPDGAVRADGQEIGKLKLVRAEDPMRLVREGTTHFSAPQGVKLVPASSVEVVQGHLETSNVNAVAGLNDLISVNRCFDAIQRVIETFQKIDDRTARDLGSRG